MCLNLWKKFQVQIYGFQSQNVFYFFEKPFYQCKLLHDRISIFVTQESPLDNLEAFFKTLLKINNQGIDFSFERGLEYDFLRIQKVVSFIENNLQKL